MTSESFAEPPLDSLHALAEERRGRIEELLLEGLDYYFAGKYERAITVWTRVAFLERGHGRARAYIERARSAQAEQQRQSEELLHAGVAAYHAGELKAARDLLTRSVEEGGPHETALVYLERLGRAESVPSLARDEIPVPRPTRAYQSSVARRLSPGWLPTLVASLAVAITVSVLSLSVHSYLVRQPVSEVPVVPLLESRLPVAGDSGRRIASARALYRSGRLHDALRLLDEVSATDQTRSQSDALRAEIQRALLAAVVGTPPRGEP